MEPKQGACINCLWRKEYPSYDDIGDGKIFTVTYGCLNAKNVGGKFNWPCEYWSRDKRKD